MPVLVALCAGFEAGQWAKQAKRAPGSTQPRRAPVHALRHAKPCIHSPRMIIKQANSDVEIVNDRGVRLLSAAPKIYPGQSALPTGSAAASSTGPGLLMPVPSTQRGHMPSYSAFPAGMRMPGLNTPGLELPPQHASAPSGASWSMHGLVMGMTPDASSMPATYPGLVPGPTAPDLAGSPMAWSALDTPSSHLGPGSRASESVPGLRHAPSTSFSGSVSAGPRPVPLGYSRSAPRDPTAIASSRDMHVGFAPDGQYNHSLPSFDILLTHIDQCRNSRAGTPCSMPGCPTSCANTPAPGPIIGPSPDTPTSRGANAQQSQDSGMTSATGVYECL